MCACRVVEIATAWVVEWLTDCGVQVFRHDPLYSWTVSPEKAQRMQAEEGGAGGGGGAVAGAGEGDEQEADGAPEAGDEGVVGNTDAARAILRVQQKLQVMEYCVCVCAWLWCCAMTSQRAH